MNPHFFRTSMYLVVHPCGTPCNHLEFAIAPRQLYLDILFAKTGSKSENQTFLKQSSENDRTLTCRVHFGAIMVETITRFCSALVIEVF